MRTLALALAAAVLVAPSPADASTRTRACLTSNHQTTVWSSTGLSYRVVRRHVERCRVYSGDRLVFRYRTVVIRRGPWQQAL